MKQKKKIGNYVEVVPIEHLVGSDRELGELFELVQDFKLEAILDDYTYELDNEEVCSGQFLVCSESLFVEDIKELSLETELVVDVFYISGTPSFSRPYRDLNIKCRDLKISKKSIEINKSNPKAFGQQVARTISLQLPLFCKDDTYNIFRKITYNKQSYILSKRQAKVLWFLVSMKKLGIKEVESYQLLESIGENSQTTKLRDVFRSGDGENILNSVIIPADKRGRWKLAEDF